MMKETINQQPLVFTLAVSEAVFLTTREMVAAGLSKDYIIGELEVMYEGYGLTKDWFERVWEGAVALQDFDDRCNQVSGSI